MARTLIVIAAFLTLSVSAAFAVPPAGKGKPESPGKSAVAPGQSADKNAAKACKAERGTTDATVAAFKARYGTNANKANAFGKCVSGKAKKAEAEDEAVRAGRGERGQEVQGGARHNRCDHRRFQGEVRDERQQGERLRQVRLEAGEGTDVVLS